MAEETEQRRILMHQAYVNFNGSYFDKDLLDEGIHAFFLIVYHDITRELVTTLRRKYEENEARRAILRVLELHSNAPHMNPEITLAVQTMRTCCERAGILERLLQPNDPPPLNPPPLNDDPPPLHHDPPPLHHDPPPLHHDPPPILQEDVDIDMNEDEDPLEEVIPEDAFEVRQGRILLSRFLRHRFTRLTIPVDKSWRKLMKIRGRTWTAYQHDKLLNQLRLLRGARRPWRRLAIPGKNKCQIKTQYSYLSMNIMETLFGHLPPPPPQ